MQANSKNETPKVQIAILARILELVGGSASIERLSVLFLLVQKQILCQFGIVISANDRFSLGEKTCIELLADSKKRDSFFNKLFLVENDIVSLTSIGLESIRRTDYESDFAIYGYLCDADNEIVTNTASSSLSEDEAKAEVVQFFGSNSEFQAWNEIIGQRKEWDAMNPHLRSYLIENELIR
ncbi:hypothetical protein D3C87_605220 [compost metagenome]